jgi:putative pre-16S rRNA nuclease
MRLNESKIWSAKSRLNCNDPIRGEDGSASILRSYGICGNDRAGRQRSEKLRRMHPIVGLDFGRARIGLAISDELQLLAHPLETIPANEHALSRIAQIVHERKVDQVVIGMPRQMNGQMGAAATEVCQFVEKLRAILPCTIVPWDERLTTAAAHRALRDAGKKTRQTRGYVDQVAAQMILQSYLDSRAAGAEPEVVSNS